MATFVVILDDQGSADSKTVKDRLTSKYSDVYEYLPTVFLVSADAITTNVSETAGFKDNSASGVVFRFKAYQGYTDGSLWEWIDKVKLGTDR